MEQEETLPEPNPIREEEGGCLSQEHDYRTACPYRQDKAQVFELQSVEHLQGFVVHLLKALGIVQQHRNNSPLKGIKGQSQTID